MKTHGPLCFAGALVVYAGAAGFARAEEPQRRVRATATVEVIDDARHVDDIISRQKSQSAPTRPAADRTAPAGDRAVRPTTGGTPAPNDAHKIERPPLPPASHAESGTRGAAGEHADKSSRRTEHRIEREQHPAPTAAHHHHR